MLYLPESESAVRKGRPALSVIEMPCTVTPLSRLPVMSPMRTTPCVEPASVPSR